MNPESSGRIGGFQTAFLIFAIVFLAYPTQKYLVPLLGIEPGPVVARLFIFVPLAAMLALVPQYRRFAIAARRTSIAPGSGVEVALVAAAKALLPFAIGGAVVLWHWTLGGEMALAKRLGQEPALSRGLSMESLVLFFFVAGVVAPLVEELLFRGLLYRAWEARWGWFPAMLATSALFAAYHPVPFGAFVSSIVFVALLRRTGSLWAPILVHGFGNMLLSPLLLGRLYFNPSGKETGEIGLWPFHLAALAVLAIALPVYLWLARDSRLAACEEPTTEIRCA